MSTRTTDYMWFLNMESLTNIHMKQAVAASDRPGREFSRGRAELFLAGTGAGVDAK